MELAKRLVALFSGLILGIAVGGLAYGNLLNSKNYVLPHDVYECAVGITMENVNYCLVYAAKGFIPKDETPSSGRGNNNREQGKPIRSQQQTLRGVVEN